MKKFNIGDRVKCLRPTDSKKEIVGKYGTVIYTYYIDEYNEAGVEFDEYIDGHSGAHHEGKDGYCWNCNIATLEKISETKLEDITLQKGDRVVFGDGEIYYEIEGNGFFVKEGRRVVKVERPTGYTTIYEAPKDILDKEEKEYLSVVIKPFRNKDTRIKKVYLDNLDKEYIYIRINTGKTKDGIMLPFFKKGTMYKGMESDKEYTLKELGL